MFQREWCKYLRKVYSEQYGKAYDWQGGKHCDCTTVCLRKSRIVQKQETAGAHRNEGKGMGIKVSDALVAPLCWGCHYILDQGKQLSREERRDFWNRSFINGMQYLIENKKLVIK